MTKIEIRKKVKVLEINDVSLVLKEKLKNLEDLEIRITHNYLSTFIDLSDINNKNLIFLNSKESILNKITIKEKSTGPFFILTQAKMIHIENN